MLPWNSSRWLNTIEFVMKFVDVLSFSGVFGKIRETLIVSVEIHCVCNEAMKSSGLKNSLCLSKSVAYSIKFIESRCQL